MTPALSDPSSQPSWIRRRFLHPVLALLRSGLTVDEVAKALALGCTTGLSPLIGTTTMTGSTFAMLLRLNPVACLTANYGVYPAQVLMVLPFARLGHELTGWRNLPLSPLQVRDLFRSQGFGALETLGTTLANATIAWLLCTPLIFFVAHRSFRTLLHRRKDR